MSWIGESGRSTSKHIITAEGIGVVTQEIAIVVSSNEDKHLVLKVMLNPHFKTVNTVFIVRKCGNKIIETTSYNKAIEMYNET